MTEAVHKDAKSSAAERARAERLLEALELEQVERDLFRGRNEVEGEFRLFGGQVLAQSLLAASATVDDQNPPVHVHSVHAYFLRAGDASRPVVYEVDRIRDGRSFVTRRVVAVQRGRAIFSASLSYQRDEPGFEHAHPMPNVPPPEELEDDIATVAALPERHRNLSPMAGRPRPFEQRSVFALGSSAWQRERFWNPVWIRFAATVPAGNPHLPAGLLAYASDMGLVSTAALPHSESLPRSDLYIASLDHALWVHRPVPMDDWLLFHKRTSNATGARGLIHGEFFSRRGELVASVTQEGLLRRQRQPGA